MGARFLHRFSATTEDFAHHDNGRNPSDAGLSHALIDAFASFPHRYRHQPPAPHLHPRNPRMIRMRRVRLRVLGVGVAALLATTCEVQPSAPRVDVNASEPAAGGARVARVIAPKKLGFSHPTGLAYSAKAGML